MTVAVSSPTAASGETAPGALADAHPSDAHLTILYRPASPATPTEGIKDLRLRYRRIYAVMRSIGAAPPSAVDLVSTPGTLSFSVPDRRPASRLLRRFRVPRVGAIEQIRVVLTEAFGIVDGRRTALPVARALQSGRRV